LATRVGGRVSKGNNKAVSSRFIRKTFDCDHTHPHGYVRWAHVISRNEVDRIEHKKRRVHKNH
jgi:hypothetical protein